MTCRRTLSLLFVTALLVALPEQAGAARLEPGPEAPLWKHLGAKALLIAHIGGGLIGLTTGVVAVAARKGARLHRLAGRLFFWSMGITYLIGAGVAPFLAVGQRPNFIAGVLALYLLVTGISAAKRRNFEARTSDALGMLVALAVTLMGAAFMVMGARSETGTVDGSPPQAFVLFLVLGAFALLGDLNAIRRRQLTAPMRTARHLWRMCAAFFLGTGSLFLGQPQLFSDAFNASPLPFLLAFAPMIALGVWMLKVRAVDPWRLQRSPGSVEVP